MYEPEVACCRRRHGMSQCREVCLPAVPGILERADASEGFSIITGLHLQAIGGPINTGRITRRGRRMDSNRAQSKRLVKGIIDPTRLLCVHDLDRIVRIGKYAGAAATCNGKLVVTWARRVKLVSSHSGGQGKAMVAISR